MSLAWFSEHNLTMFQISATAGNLCSKLLVKYTPLLWGKSPLPIVLKLRYPYLKHCFTDTRSRLLCKKIKKKKKEKKKKNMMSNLGNFNFLWHGSPTHGKGGTVIVEVPIQHLDWRGKNKFMQQCLLHPQKRWAGKLITHTHTHTQKEGTETPAS